LPFVKQRRVVSSFEVAILGNILAPFFTFLLPPFIVFLLFADQFSLFHHYFYLALICESVAMLGLKVGVVLFFFMVSLLLSSFDLLKI